MVVVVAGSPLDLEEFRGRVDAVLWSWYAGQAGGEGLARALLGVIDPSGRLPSTLYGTGLERARGIEV